MRQSKGLLCGVGKATRAGETRGMHGMMVFTESQAPLTEYDVTQGFELNSVVPFTRSRLGLFVVIGS